MDRESGPPQLLEESCSEEDTDTGSESGSESEATESSGSENEVEVNNEISREANCLFCPEMVVPDREIFFVHLKKHHGIDMVDFKKRFQMDQLSFIQFVNYCRVEKPGPEILVKLSMSSDSVPWVNDKFFQPVIDDDELLQIDFETEQEDMSTETEAVTTDLRDESKRELSYQDLLNANQMLVKEKEDQTTVLNHFMTTMEEMKDFVKRFIEDSSEQSSTVKDAAAPSKSGNKKSDKESEDDYYFESYDEVGIHATMIRDVPRTEAYMNAILKNSEHYKDKIVMDLGCGTGILSLFAAKAGAKLVYAVDRSKIIFEALETISENGFQNTIKCVKGSVETITAKCIPDQVDIIVSEWMGYMLLYEAMLNSVIIARDLFMKPDGHIVPNIAEIWIVGVCDEEQYKRDITMWDDVYGFKMGAMKRRAHREAVIDVVEEGTIITDSGFVHSIDLEKCTLLDGIVNNEFVLNLKKDSLMTHVAGYFEAKFDSHPTYQCVLSTSPFSTPTHWKQCVFPLSKVKSYKAGDSIKGRFQCRPNENNARALSVTLTVDGLCTRYELQ